MDIISLETFYKVFSIMIMSVLLFIIVRGIKDINEHLAYMDQARAREKAFFRSINTRGLGIPADEYRF